MSPKYRGGKKPTLGPSRFSLIVLRALQSKPIYLGTVPVASIAKRRAANRVAKASRKANR